MATIDMHAEYYIKGFVTGKFKHADGLCRVLADLSEHGPKAGYTWEQKYPGTLDLRPSAHLYDPIILNILVSSSVTSMVSDIVGDDIVMSHVQIRKSFAGPSYMDWHRDSYIHDNKLIGHAPPTHKLIFYPKLTGTSSTKLKISVGSHRLQLDNRDDDIRVVVKRLPEFEYKSSDDEFVFFNTSLLHAAAPEDETSIRIIYSFIRRCQYESLLAGQEIHDEQVRLYEELKR